MANLKKSSPETARRILLATDLGCRSDRAFDRAVQLAQQWDATLIVLYVAPHADSYVAPSWQRGATLAELVERQVRLDLGERHVDLQILVDVGEPYKVALRRAAEYDCQLIVVGISRDSLLGRHRLGGTVEKLMQYADRPVLTVKQRAHGIYTGSVVATDFSACARHAMECAAGLFPYTDFAVLHTYRVPFERFGQREASAAAHAMAVQALDRFVADVQLPSEIRSGVKTMVEYGHPADVLNGYLRERPHDLVVVGARGDSGVFDRLVGSNAMAITAEVYNDVLIVRDGGEAASHRTA
ncbi:universal stress protein [Solimonas variicoloris]|uniref:universal stress protein n=1 Tax=Solimonas variicoloris TaxID=254408 RepID=UPI00035F9E65|nr:universal stress protein [Solimonas variicoloris]